MAQVPAGHPEKPEGADGFKLVERMNGGHHEELSLWGLSFLDVGERDHALDIGCGGGANLSRLLQRAPQGHVTGVDYSPVSVQASRAHNQDAIAQGRCTVLDGNASSLPIPDESMDVVTAFETTYYWDLPTAFAEVARVLKPQGRFLVCNEDDGESPEALEFARLIPGMVMHTSGQLCEALRSAGLEVETTEAIPEKGHLAIVARKPGDGQRG